MITRVLVANRAEIASRVFRTCRTLGIQTVAIHSDADAGLPFVREADVSVRLAGDAPADTYLDIDAVLHAAKRTGSDAIHPGYGFLSENADFARAVEAAGLTWIGPSPESIDAMGSKIEAKRIMRDAGVPVLDAPEPPTDADLPLIVKASAGGGGRGMRIVRDLASLDTEIVRARDEAASAFGDGTVFVEPYVERGRHVEVQVVGDRHGDVLVLGERDCSIQRRHQKVVEEAPAPDLAPEVARSMHEAARAAAEAIGYVGAGTVEFLYDPETERFFFLEMNTRLQVEHPVTEEVFGVDLVELQLAVAEGHRLDARRPVVEVRGAPATSLETPGPTGPTGHVIEVRLYAEDPAHDFRPQSGRLTAFELPEGDGIRVEAGFESGSEVSTHYDAMLAKVIAHGPTRVAAARRLAAALEGARIHGVTTNRDLLVRILRDPDFLAGRVGTDFLERTSVVAACEPAEPHRHLVVAATIALAEDRRARRAVQRGIPVGWRNVTSQPQLTTFEASTGSAAVEWFGGRDGYRFDGLEVAGFTPRSVTLVEDGISATYAVRVDGTAVEVDGPLGHARLVERPRFTDPAEQHRSGSLLAPMPGTVVSVEVRAGDQVAAGAPVLMLEAMKMQHPVVAPHAGTVTEIDVRPGAQVAAGEVLAVVEEEQA